MPVISSETSPQGALKRYVVVGLLLCAVLQLVFWRQVGYFGVPGADWPFLAAYSQKAILDLMVFDSPGPLRIALWFLAYLAMAWLAWLVVSRITPNRSGRWGTVVLAWIGIQVILRALGFILFRSGVLRME
jgi:hypothetical protein